MTRKVFVLFIIAGSLAVTACNTVRGAGQDLQSAADAVDQVDD